MIDAGKKNIVGVLVNAMDYEAAVDFVVRAAHERRAATVATEPIHGVMSGVLDREHQYRLNHFSLILPDAQGVRWGMNLLYGTRLRDRVYGPNLTLALCTRAEQERLPVYFYGSNPGTIQGLKRNLSRLFPNLPIAGMEAGQYRRLSPQEKESLADRIRQSDASMVFVGLGCPRQEVWAYEFCNLLPMPILAVGAAFPFLAGELRQAPLWMQNSGLEGVFRLCMEPRRLWRRYVLLSPAYVVLLTLQALGALSFTTEGTEPTAELLYG
jgi:N-acetylglucosaminyldiphosphoundecaprenol N-acetyl-beta-D-mannosaminyltransferase